MSGDRRRDRRQPGFPGNHTAGYTRAPSFPAVTSLVETELALGQLDRVEALLREGIQVAWENGNRFTHAMLQEQLAQILHSKRNTFEAHQLCQASIVLYRELGDEWSLSRALNLLGNFELVEQDDGQAQQFFVEALKIAYQANSFANALDALTGIATVQANGGKGALALEIIFYTLQSPNSTHQAQDTVQRLLTELEPQLAPEQIEAVRLSARHQSLDQIIEKVIRATAS